LSSTAIFWLQVVVSTGVFALITVWYVWPRLVTQKLNSALAPLLFVNVFRYVGMTLLVNGMVDSRLSHHSLAPSAYGDLLAAALALGTIVALRSNWRYAIPLAWVANTWGFLDLLNTLRNIISTNLPSYQLESTWWVFIFLAPLVIISEVGIFVMLIKAKTWAKAPAQPAVPVHS
jgi:hypothetical protein